MALADALNGIVRLATRADHSVINCAYGDKGHRIKISDGEYGLWKRDYIFREDLV